MEIYMAHILHTSGTVKTKIKNDANIHIMTE